MDIFCAKFSEYSYLAVTEPKNSKPSRAGNGPHSASLTSTTHSLRSWILLGLFFVIFYSLRQSQKCDWPSVHLCFRAKQNLREHTFLGGQESQYKETFSPGKCFQGTALLQAQDSCISQLRLLTSTGLQLGAMALDSAASKIHK